MKIYSEQRLHNFEFWSGAVSRAEQLTYDELDELENILEDMYPDGIEDTELNDLFWFDFSTVCEWLGLELDDNEDVIREEDEEEDEEEE